MAVEHVESLGGEQIEVGSKIHVSALVRLGDLSPDDIQVQLVTGRVSEDDRLYEPRVTPFPTGVDVDGGLRPYESWVEAKRAGAIACAGAAADCAATRVHDAVAAAKHRAFVESIGDAHARANVAVIGLIGGAAVAAVLAEADTLTG